MIYTVSEVSEITKLSKVSIYSRFKLKEIEPYLTKKQGVAFVTDEGLKIILDDLKENIEPPINNLNEKASQTQDNIKENKQDLSFKEDYISTLKTQLQVKDTQILENNLQLKTKDIQIQDLNDRLSQEQKLHENTQVLFKQQLPQDQLLLETHFEDLNSKLEEVKSNMAERKEQQKKGFFSKIFNK